MGWYIRDFYTAEKSFILSALQQIMEDVVKLLAPINTTKLEGHAEGTDISPWMKAGVPGELLLSFLLESMINLFYFKYLSYRMLNKLNDSGNSMLS